MSIAAAASDCYMGTYHIYGASLDLTQRTTHLLYLHGFRSSPQSFKAQLVTHTLASQHPHVTVWCPQLPPSPADAMQMLLEGTRHWPAASSAVVGSSLGGFYATALAQHTGWARAVLLNPAVNPARDLEKYIGEHTHWHNPEERFFFQPAYVQQLRELCVPDIQHPERYLVVIAKGDEVLDWREMQTRYAQAQVLLLEGGDHALSDFEAHLPQVLAFLGLGPPF